MARPSKLTAEISERICRAIRAGNRPAVAARAAGIGESTFYRWIERGRSCESGIHREFYEAVGQAGAESEVHAVAVIRKMAPQQWRAAAFLLERNHGWIRPTEPAREPEQERPTIDVNELSEAELRTLERINARATKRS